MSLLYSTIKLNGIPPSIFISNIPPLLPPEEMLRGPPRGDDRGPPMEARDMKLPSALEKVLAFKDARAQEVGLTTEEIEEMNRPERESHWVKICVGRFTVKS